jgi:hypothetical protein
VTAEAAPVEAADEALEAADEAPLATAEVALATVPVPLDEAEELEAEADEEMMFEAVRLPQVIFWHWSWAVALPALVARHWPLYSWHLNVGMVFWYSDMSGETPLLQTQV